MKNMRERRTVDIKKNKLISVSQATKRLSAWFYLLLSVFVARRQTRLRSGRQAAALPPADGGPAPLAAADPD